jgi:tRNA dimethylallyltransferase
MGAVRPRVLVIAGPTGAGKSDYAWQVAQRLPVEIISVDSAQVYRGMDIGTAKPSAAEQAAVPHHLLDLCEPEAVYSAGQFRRDVLDCIAQIAGRGRVPLLVGGTMLYFRSLFQGIASMPQADTALRAELDARAARDGWPALHAQLAQLDPVAAQRIHVNDAQRIQRALEVLTLSGTGLTQLWQQPAPGELPFDSLLCVLQPGDRALLHQRLALRLDAMLAAGFVEEVQRLLQRPGLTVDSPALRAVGYRQMLAYCSGELSLSAAREQAVAATRQLAKRQMTWLRSASLWPDAQQPLNFDPQAADSLERFMTNALQWLERADQQGR